MNEVDYCREIESYLCRKNGGHLIRIVGPAFETVRGWSEQGVPLKIVLRGIDRCVDRANAKGGRRRPLRVEFCEADVLTLFDDWRRAIGVGTAQVGAVEESGEAETATPAKGSLPAHIRRSVARLLAVRSEPPDPAFDAVITATLEELDALAADAVAARGDERSRIVNLLAEMDGRLLDAARPRLDAAAAAALQREADAELSGLAGRMPADGLARARQLAFERLLRESLNLPVLTYE